MPNEQYEMSHKPVMLLIRDGWGINPGGREAAVANGDATLLARTPFHDELYKRYPRARLSASGLDVGLPVGQMGNSEVGHMNLGAGRIIYQELTRINKAIADGTLAQNTVLQETFAKARGSRLHFLGLVSDGGVHSHYSHLVALANAAKNAGVSDIMVHAFTDGRDTSPTGGADFLATLDRELKASGARIVTVVGRYYAMDRDRRWDRTKLAWDAIVCGEGKLCDQSLSAAITEQYTQGKTDEFLAPLIFDLPNQQRVRDHDVIFFFNFRADRARQLSQAFIFPGFKDFDRRVQPKVHYVTMTEYDESYGVPFAFAPETFTNILGEVVSRAGKKQLRIAETEKYPHVTYFFNAGNETPFPGEDRTIIPSPKVATYDLKPEMSALEVTETVLARMADYDLIILNFANPDMVGHTGVVEAGIKAVETVDACCSRIIPKLLSLGGKALVTADHGNCELMRNPDGSPNTAHTTNLVHFIYVAEDSSRFHVNDGILADVAPTILFLLGLDQPIEMSGHNLLVPRPSPYDGGLNRNLEPNSDTRPPSRTRTTAVPFNLAGHGFTVPEVHRNLPPSALYEHAIRHEKDASIADNGALVAYSGVKTGRSPKNKRVVENPDSKADVWWGSVNIPCDQRTFRINRQRAIDYLNTRPRLYCIDAFAGWDPNTRVKVRVICSLPYHALFMHNMLIRPTREELANFGTPEFVIINAGAFPANRLTTGMGSTTSIDLSLEDREVVILGTEYAGEMKKAVFTAVNYFAPKYRLLSMHCSATANKETGSSSLLFGLSGTGKTTLSADPKRFLIGDDEHVWSDTGIFNIEGGCYAKAINLTPESEPDIFQALRFGAVLENVVLDEDRMVDYSNVSITQNTRGAYPIEFIQNAKIPCIAGHPTDIIFLTCDAFGVLPPIASLSPAHAMYHFISGYTAKVAGTEVGINEPQATFSPCFGGPFLVWHANKYAQLLAEKMRKHHSRVWLINTGWSGGAYGTGKRMSLKHTRAIIDAIHSSTLASPKVERDPIFGFNVVTEVAGVPTEILRPREAWLDKSAYDATAKKLAALFNENFKTYLSGVTDEIKAAAPVS